MKRMKDVITQIRTWACRLTALKERRHLYPIADEMKKEADRLEEGGYLIVTDLDNFEECGLFDREISTIIDSSDMTFAIDEDVGRKDPTTGEVWTIAWVRVRKPGDIRAKNTVPWDDLLPWRGRKVRVKDAFLSLLLDETENTPRLVTGGEWTSEDGPLYQLFGLDGEWPPQMLEICEDRCEHGMFFSGAGACPQCGQ
jgi:hypothetical protein